ncbi:hypothetical protein SISNIDRAFT_488634 [Sistotremastrum niveocremeum HHB9708]|uniref:Uncharacterized protein n=1 Tax=Sistotremastrum niveocremeum HHB9708 TaxID=1314777 RepID=A0A164QZ70_9AGAM|nr:hypothetical protein SISNIDRAFT_488634 [Sistotremastrum niveocremeum HHB9708]
MADALPDPLRSNPRAPTEGLIHEITRSELTEEDSPYISPSSVQTLSFPRVDFVTANLEISKIGEPTASGPQRLKQTHLTNIDVISSYTPPSVNTDLAPDLPALSSPAHPMLPPALLEQQAFALVTLATPSHHRMQA